MIQLTKPPSPNPDPHDISHDHPTLSTAQIIRNNNRATRAAVSHGITANDTTQHIPRSPILLTRPRPGRTLRERPIDPNPEQRFGDAISQKDSDSTRIFFQNVKGLTYSNTCEDYRYYLSCLRAYHVDIAGLAETNTCWSHPHLQAAFRNSLRSIPGQSKVAFGYPNRDIDPCHEKETFQAGGNLTLVTGAAVSQIHGLPINDPTGLGRWSGITFQGKLGTLITMITGYRTCSGSIRTSPLGSTFIREHTHFQKIGEKKSKLEKNFLSRSHQPYHPTKGPRPLNSPHAGCKRHTRKGYRSLEPTGTLRPPRPPPTSSSTLNIHRLSQQAHRLYLRMRQCRAKCHTLWHPSIQRRSSSRSPGSLR